MNKFLIDGEAHSPSRDEIKEADCAMECGNKIGDWQDDVGGFYVKTPNHGYAAICWPCWRDGLYSTCER